MALQVLQSIEPITATDVAEGFIGMWRALLVSTDCSVGCIDHGRDRRCRLSRPVGAYRSDLR